jgi:hypothetical protein
MFAIFALSKVCSSKCPPEQQSSSGVGLAGNSQLSNIDSTWFPPAWWSLEFGRVQKPST